MRFPVLGALSGKDGLRLLALGRLGLVYTLFAFGDLRKRAALFLKAGIYTHLTFLHKLQDGLVQEFIKQKQQKEEADYGENKL